MLCIYIIPFHSGTVPLEQAETLAFDQGLVAFGNGLPSEVFLQTIGTDVREHLPMIS